MKRHAVRRPRFTRTRKVAAAAARKVSALRALIFAAGTVALGVFLVVIGVGMIYRPAGVILAGLAVGAVGLVVVDAGKPRR